MGVSSRRWDDDIDDLARARQVPSPQLIGTPERRTLDLGTLRRAGVELVGRLVGVGGGRLQFAGSLANLVANADLKQARLLDQVDEFIADTGIAASSPDRPPPTIVDTPRDVARLVPASTPWCGPPDTATRRRSSIPSTWIGGAGSSTTAGCSARPACSRSGCRSCVGGARRS